MTDKHFPQVADDELMLTQMPHMNYMMMGTSLVIFLGSIQIKNYLEWGANCNWKGSRATLSKNLQKSLQKPFEVPKSRRQPMTPDFKEPVDKKSPAKSLRRRSS